nr:TM0106 family RecB-like putative nuclease [Actinomycetota bacterium]
MRLSADGTLRLSPSDLANHLACPHLTQLELKVQREGLKRPVLEDAYGSLIREKGNLHELAYLEQLGVAGKRVLRMPTYEDEGFDSETARQATEEAIRAGEADVVYQAYLSDGTWRGFADFLERRTDGTYEPVDTKLARSAKPLHILQLCFYAEQLERIQGQLPEEVHVELGSGLRESFRTADYIAFFRRSRERFLSALGWREAGDSPLRGQPPTYPWPCEHCSICDFRHLCYQRRVDDDHLVLVAGLGRRHAETLAANGVATLTELGETAAVTGVKGVRPETFESLRHQAELQLFHAQTGEHHVDHLPDEEDKGFRLLPAPSSGDVWLDLEGHPFYEPARGLEYLFGCCYRDDEGTVRYESIWGTDRVGEKAAFERFVDWVVERRRRFPELHVYHYAAYERTAIRRLMGEHAVREDEIDDLLRQEVLVDLYRVVKQALRASVPGYSIKEVEKLFGFVRTADVSGGAESAVLFDQWIEAQDDSLLDRIRQYNEEDCRSLQELHEWLISRRPPSLPWRPPPEDRERSEEAEERDAERARLHATLLAGAVEGDPRWLLAHLLYYHRREAKSQWWEWFHHLGLVGEELVEDDDTIGGIELAGEPVLDKQSFVYTLGFPPQEHKIGGDCVDPSTQKGCKVRVDDERGLITLRRSRKRAGEPLPAALIPSQPLSDWLQRDAVARFARWYTEGETSLAPTRYRALAEVLERRPPRARLDLPVAEAALSLDGSYLFVQGPPGVGKTWQGAKAAVALMRAGRRVGVTSLSHKAIHKLLEEIEREAREKGFRFRGRKKSTDGVAETRFEGDFVDSSDEWRELLDPELQLVAGTAWLFARSEFDLGLADKTPRERGLAEARPRTGRTPFCDTLIVDEAGQMSLADVLAVGTAARNLVFLGDPNQLPQVSQGAMPEEAKRSVSSTSSPTRRRCRPTAGSSSSGRGACGRNSPGSPRR